MERPATAGWMLDTRDFSGTFSRRTNEMLTVFRFPVSEGHIHRQGGLEAPDGGHSQREGGLTAAGRSTKLMMGRGRRGVEEGVVNFRGAKLSENGFNYEFHKSSNDVYKSGNVVSTVTSSRTGNDGFFEASRYWVSIP